MSEDLLSHFLPISLNNSNSSLRFSLVSTSSLNVLRVIYNKINKNTLNIIRLLKCMTEKIIT